MYRPIPLNDPSRMNRALVRVYDSTGAHIVGGGFLVTNRQILTCAHVVEEATGLSTPLLINDAHVWVDFPFLSNTPNSNTPKLKAWVDAPWAAKSANDIAHLKLESLVQNTYPVPLCASVNNMLNQSIKCTGFPIESGITATGKIVAQNADGWYQFTTNDTPISQGFSGCPVWHETLGGVVGMVTGKVEFFTKGTAFFIPTFKLMQMWGELPLTWSGDIPGSFPIGRLEYSNGYWNVGFNELGYHCSI